VLILSKSLAVEGAPHHITVNVLAPGLMDNGTLNASGRRAAAARIPAGRPGTAEDLAGALLYLCSEEAAYVTGAHIPVSGGWGL
ncbi:MAG TPA: SDR family oxidoreductase, partial [bacterium]|nr:SDR family oxidoreductase [bacterium]